jgi:structural maintenance of chromosome 3 (chondroitin sulfate proteoglycan 6)
MMNDGTLPVYIWLNCSELWRLEAKTLAEEDSAKEELRKAEQQLYNTMDRNVQTGLATATRIAKDLKLTGYYGPLYELFTLADSRYRTAAEVSAGGRYSLLGS